MKFFILVLIQTVMIGITIQTLLHADVLSSNRPNRRLSDVGVLRKASLHIRGFAPTADEYQELADIRVPEARAQFIEAKVTEYLRSKWHENRMVFRLSERFRIRTPSLNSENPEIAHALPKDYPIFFTPGPDALTDLFARVARENLSWDELFTGKSYNLYPQTLQKSAPFNYGPSSDFGFYRAVKADISIPFESTGAVDSSTLDQKEASADFVLPISFAADDARVAGALTTPRFVGRYSTTAINKNRRRAAAVFDIAFCDTMIPSIANGGSDRKHEFLDKGFAKNFIVTDQDIAKVTGVSANARHGTDSDCMACHMKLDPMGRTFQISGLALNPVASPGALVLVRPGKQIFMQKVKGLGDLGEAITKQPEYEDCQVTYFWNQFIGNDVALTRNRKNSLIEKFNQVGRKTNDFIKALVLSDDFAVVPKTDGLVPFSAVKPLLKRCDSCHNDEGTIPPFSSLPIGFSETKKENQEWLQNMNKRLNLPDSNKDKMPKDWRANWSDDDINLVKNWIRGGAADDDGNPMFEPNSLPGVQP
jgi:hypothetical protein